MKTKWMAALLISLTLTNAAMADGMPASQFGYRGWPNRQSTNCDTEELHVTITARPPALPSTPGPTVKPDDKPECAPPVLPDFKPATPQPTATNTPAATPVPTPDVTITPLPQPEYTLAPKPTQKPEPSPTAVPKPTATPKPAVTQKPEAKPTEKPAIPTVTPSAGEDYTTPSITKQEEIAFLLLSADRKANGLGELILDPALCSLARMKSCDMKINNYFAHYSPTYGSASDMLRSYGYHFSAVGENIAHHANVEKAQAAFMSSTGHRSNILSKSWSRVGIGVCVDEQGFVYITQLFVR